MTNYAKIPAMLRPFVSARSLDPAFSGILVMSRGVERAFYATDAASWIRVTARSDVHELGEMRRFMPLSAFPGGPGTVLSSRANPPQLRTPPDADPVWEVAFPADALKAALCALRPLLPARAPASAALLSLDCLCMAFRRPRDVMLHACDRATSLRSVPVFYRLLAGDPPPKDRLDILLSPHVVRWLARFPDPAADAVVTVRGLPGGALRLASADWTIWTLSPVPGGSFPPAVRSLCALVGDRPGSVRVRMDRPAALRRALSSLPAGSGRILFRDDPAESFPGVSLSGFPDARGVVFDRRALCALLTGLRKPVVIDGIPGDPFVFSSPEVPGSTAIMSVREED